MIRWITGSAVHLAALEIWLVGVMVAASVVSARVLPYAVAVAAIYWLIRWLATGRLSVRTPGDWVTGLLLLLLPVTLWTTALPEVTRLQVYRLLTGVALYYAVVNWAGTASRLRLAMLGAGAVGLLLAFSAPFSVQWMIEEKLTFMPEVIYRRLPLLLADPIHPNVMAGALVVLLPCALAPLLFGWQQLRWFERTLVGLAAAAMLGVLILTKSRGGLMALGAMLVVLIVLRWRWGWLAVPLAVLAAGLAIWWIGEVRVVEALSATQTLGGMDGRLEVWSRALYMLQDFPFTGIGMGTFQQVANRLYPFFLAGPDAEVPHAHNIFLQVGVDLGLPGLVAWLALLILVCICAWWVYRRGRRQGDAVLTALGAGLLASQAALVVHGLTDAATWGTRPAVVVWAIWGLAMAALTVITEPQTSTTQG
jgi:putative inorganic carbon (hco3(-)) transporter